MELLHDPDFKERYDKCKKTVKIWEYKFKKMHGRIPSKHDIHEADKKIRDAYRTYFRMKTAVLEESLSELDGFSMDLETSDILTDCCTSTVEEQPSNTEETWGKHLSVKVDANHVKNNVKSKTNVNESFTKKLFVGSKFSKRNPRKSQTFSQINIKSKSNLSLSQPGTDENLPFEDFTKSFVTDVESSVNISTKFIPDLQHQPLNITQILLNETSSKPLRSVDLGWLKRLNACDIELDESNDIIENSDEEEYSHVAKRLKLSRPLSETSFSSNKSVNMNLITVDTTNCNRLDFANIFNKTTSGETFDAIENHENTDDDVSNVNKTTVEKTNNDVRRKSVRDVKTIVNLKVTHEHESDEEEEDPYRCDSEDDPDYKVDGGNKLLQVCNSAVLENSDGQKSPPATKRTNKKTKGERKRTVKSSSTRAKTTRSKKDSQITCDTEDSQTYELEYSIKPRTLTVPRLKTIPITMIDDETKKPLKKTGPKDKQKSKQTLDRKAASSNLNDNFVRINLKKKVFVRGKKTMTFSKFKKRQWKNNKKKSLAGPDMDMGGCDGGTLICFKCGGEGHFARQCKVIKEDGLLPLSAAKAADQICPYPTLQEASKLAQNSVLAVRKPRKIVDDIEDEGKGEGDEYFDDNFEDELIEETIKIEDLIPKIDMRNYVDDEKNVPPLYEKTDDGKIKETPQEVFEALKLFNYTKFRPGQERAIMRILSGQSTLVTLSTGSGKSLCYQLPAYLYARRQKCISLVISPLVSLMEDQVTGIPSFLKAACLHTNQTKIQRQKIMELIETSNLDVLLVSPEAIVAGEKSTGFGSLLRKLPPIAFACIDEAHCVSQWSHNFRPSYLMICHVLRERLGVKTVLGLTATATRATSDSIVAHLRIPDGRDGIIADIPVPDNLHLSVSMDGDKDRALLSLLCSETFRECRSIIIYCTRREECERIAGYLRTALQNNPVSSPKNSKKRKRLNLQAECYHAGLAASRRRTVQKSFMSGELRIVVATVAFGMGINKPDIRSVIHYNMPRNFESYVQEVGRAGRDGLPAFCHLFLDSRGRDENELRRHIHSNSMDRHVIRKLLEKVFITCNCAEQQCPKHEVAFNIEETIRQLDIPEEIISTLLCYLELHDKRYIEILSPAYTMCKVISYGGPNEIRRVAAQDCPPLAMALALRNSKRNGDAAVDENVIEFPVIDIASAIGWDSGITKHKLKNLEWTSENNLPKRSLLTVVFSNLGFRLLSPGNLTEDELDEALDNLYSRVMDQERTALLQLHAIYSTLISVASPTYKNCFAHESHLTTSTSSNSKIDTPKSENLKLIIRDYFDCPKPLEMLPEVEIKPVDEAQVLSDVRALVTMYRDNVFTGRAIARIFHGIQSPNYPAVIWGRCKFWRAHLNYDFNTVCQIATKELIRWR